MSVDIGKVLERELLASSECFVPNHLRMGKAATVRFGPKAKPKLQYDRPWSRQGTVAIVYKMEFDDGTRKAIRCFKTEVGPEMRERYLLLSTLLASKAANFTIGFKYWEEGIEVDSGVRIPIVEMDWVRGNTLIDEVAKLCKTGKSRDLTELSRKWAELVGAMHRIEMAHGDLSGENVMLLNGELVLIDYDGVFFSQQSVLTDHPPQEWGNPLYQHPNHVGARAYNARMDDFSALAIYVALLAYAKKPDEFNRFASPIDGKLLFKESCFAAPNTSDRFRSLLSFPDSEVRRLASCLRDACDADIHQVPSFVSLIDASLQLREHIDTFPKDWRGIHHEARRLKSERIKISREPKLQKAINEAKERCSHLDALIAAEKRQPRKAREVADAFNAAQQKNMLTDWDEAKQWIPKGECAIRQVARLDELDRVAKGDPGRKRVLSLWQQHKKLLFGCAESSYWQQEAAIWQPRIDACKKLLDLVKSSPPWNSDISVADAWETFEKLKGHPDFEAVKAGKLSEIHKCRNRRDCLMRVRSVGTRVDETTDRLFFRQWNDNLLNDCPDVTQSERTRWTATIRRIEALDLAAKSIGGIRTPRATITEHDLAAAESTARSLPSVYEYHLRGRVESARNILAALKHPISDIRLAEAYSKFQQSWETALQRVNFELVHRRRIARAIRRAPVLERAYAVLKTATIDTQMDEKRDRQLTRDWRDIDLCEPPGAAEYCADANKILERVNAAKERLSSLDAFRQVRRMVDHNQCGAIDLADAGNRLPAWYFRKLPHDHARYQAAKVQAECTSQLNVAVTRTREKDIAEAWDSLEKAGGDPAAEQHRHRATMACKRRDGLNDLLHILAVGLPADQEDTRLLSGWRRYDLSGSEDATAHRDRIGLASKRTVACRDLLAALNTQNDFRVRDLYRESRRLLQGYPPIHARQSEIHVAERRSEEANKFFKIMEGPDTPEQRSAFVDRFAYAHIERYPKKSAPLMRRIRQWVAEELFKAYPFKKNLYYPMPSRKDNGVERQLVIHWIWPTAGKITHCLVNAQWDCPMQDVANPYTMAHKKLSRHDFDQADSRAFLTIPPNRGRILYVGVWPVVELRAGTEHDGAIVGSPLVFEVDLTKTHDEKPPDSTEPEPDGWFGKLANRVLSLMER